MRATGEITEFKVKIVRNKDLELDLSKMGPRLWPAGAERSPAIAVFGLESPKKRIEKIHPSQSGEAWFSRAAERLGLEQLATLCDGTTRQVRNRITVDEVQQVGEGTSNCPGLANGRLERGTQVSS